MRQVRSIWCMASSYSKTSLSVRKREAGVYKNIRCLESFWKVAFSFTLFHKIGVFKQKQTRVDGALGTGHAYRVIFENGEPARTEFSGDKTARFR